MAGDKTEGKEEQGGEQHGPRYVWDPKTLAWVESEQAGPSLEVPKEEASEETTEDIAGAEPSDEDAAPYRPRELQQKVVSKTSSEEAVAEAVSDEEMETYGAEEKKLEYRGAWIRLMSFVVDLVILFIITWIVGRIIHLFMSAPSETALVIGAVYFVGFWTWRGQTPGKILTGTRIVKANGGKIGFGTAFLRYIFYPIPFFAPLVFYATRIPYISLVIVALCFIMIAFSRTKKGPHDLIAGTCVVSTRSRVFQPVTSDDLGTTGHSDANQSDSHKQHKQG